MTSLMKVRPHVEFLGTIWRNRRTEEVAVVWSVSGAIRLIDVDWEPYDDRISDVRPINNEPKYWLAQTEEELRRDWLQVKAGWVPLEP